MRNVDSLALSKVLYPSQPGDMVTKLMPTDVTRESMADRRFLLGLPALIHSPSSYMPLAKETHKDQAGYLRHGWDWL